MNIHDISEEKLHTFLFVVSVFVYYKLYWWIYDILIYDVVYDLLHLPVPAMSVMDMILLFLYLITAIPGALGLRILLVKLLEKR